jgi:ParB/RepB/Spo0J family partition protein
MAWTPNTGEYESSRGDVFTVDPRAIVVDWKKNVSRGGVRPPVDDKLKALARSMIPKSSQKGEISDSAGQLQPITVRPMHDRRLEAVGGFRRLAGGLWLIESGECPDFKIKCIITRLTDEEAALANMEENIQREDPEPIESAHAIRTFTEDYGIPIERLASRFKRSVTWCQNLLDLVMLPAHVQESVANGHTPLNAAVELTKLPRDQQVAVFDEAKASGEKLTATKVKAQRRQNQQASGKGKSLRRSSKEIHEFFLGRTGSSAHDPGFDLAGQILDFIDGKIDEEKMYSLWDKALPLKK